MAGDGGQSAAYGLRYQYLRTLEALLEAVEEPRRGVAAVHVEGLPREGRSAPESIDYELTDEDGRVMLAVQVKARSPGTQLGAGDVFKALAALVRERDAARYELLVGACAGVSAQSLMAVLRSGLPAAQLRSSVGQVLASVSARLQLSVLGGLTDEHIERLTRTEVRFDPRDEGEITGQIRARLRQYRNHASVGLGEQSAGLLIGYLVSEIFRRAADASEATILLGHFRKLILADGATLARAIGRRDWAVVVGPLPAMPEIRRLDLLAELQDALPLVAEGVAVPNCRLTGLSGIGKTSLAAGYVFERADIYDVIFWADAESEMTLASSFSQIYRELRGPDAQVPADPVALRANVLTDLCCSPGRWLLVLDNCLDLRAVDEWVPRAGDGHVIMTTTDSASPPWASAVVPVTGLAPLQAVELLSRGLDLKLGLGVAQRGLLDRLAKELEYWPLALKLACAYLYGSYGVDGIPEYLRKMKVASLGNPALVPPRYPRPLVQAIALCVQRIEDDAASSEPATSLAAAYALTTLRISAYVSSKQIPVHLVLSATAIAPGEDAFRGTGPIIMDRSAPAAADVVRVLRSQSLVAVDEQLPEGSCGDESCECSFTIQVNSVIQEVTQDAFAHDPETREVLDRLAWHAERWLRAAIDGGAHERALILAAHSAVIEAHASRIGRDSDFVAYLRGQLAVVYAKQNKMGEAARLLRSEISQFKGRSEEHSRLLKCQASIQLATCLATILLDDGAAPTDMAVDVVDIASLLEDAYFYVRDFHPENPEGAAHLVGSIQDALQGLALSGATHERLVMLRTAVEDLASRLPSTELSRAKQVCQEMVDCMEELRDVPRVVELATNLLQQLGDAEAHEGIQVRCHARKMLIEALAMQDDLDAALTELDLFIADAQPPALYVRELEYLMHNVGMKCTFLSWIRFPMAAEMLSRLLSGGRAELVQHAFPGQGAARVGLLRGVDALHDGDLDAARAHVNEFRLLDENAPHMRKPQRQVSWRHIADVLEDSLDIEKGRGDGFARGLTRQHEYSGVARYTLLPSPWQSALGNCPADALPLYAALAAMTTSYAPSVSNRPVPACQLLQGALKHLGLRSTLIAAIVRVEHRVTGVVQHVGACEDAPVLHPDGDTSGHVVLWVKTLGRLVDPTLLQLQHLGPGNENEGFPSGEPFVFSLPGIEVLFTAARGAPIVIQRGSLLVSWEPQPQWTKAVTPIPGSDLAVGLDYGKLALAHAALDLIRGVRALGLQPEASQKGVHTPLLASLLDGRAQLPALTDTPSEQFRHVFRSAEGRNHHSES